MMTDGISWYVVVGIQATAEMYGDIRIFSDSRYQSYEMRD